MKRQEFGDINNALLNIVTHRPKGTTDQEILVRDATICGFMMWLDEYYEEHKEE